MTEPVIGGTAWERRHPSAGADREAGTTSNTDADLEIVMTRVALGDSAAFGMLYDATCSHLFAVTGWKDQVLLNAYVRIWQEAPTYRPGADGVLAWCLRFAHESAGRDVHQPGVQSAG